MEGLDLTKGLSLDLTKKVPSLKKVRVGLGWDIDEGTTIDLDVAAFVLENWESKTKKIGNICYFNQLSILNGSVVHQWDNRTGIGEGDDEGIIVDLEKLEKELSNVSDVVFAVFIFEPKSVDVTFGKVKNSFIRIINDETNEEIAKYKLEEDYFSSKAINFGKLSRENWSWKFTAVGEEIVWQIPDTVGKTFEYFTA